MTTPPNAIDGSAPQPAHMSAVARMSGVIISPKATYADIAAKPGWVVPLVTFIVLFVAIIVVFGKRVGWRDFLEKQFDKSSQTASLSADEKEQRLDTAVKFAPAFGYVEAFVGIPIVALIIAAIMMLVFNLVAGARVSFLQSLSIVSYSWVPAIIGTAIGLILLFVKAPDTIDLEHLVADNAGAFLSGDSPRWLMTLCTSLNVFVFWTLALMGIGYSAVTPKKVSIGKGIAMVVICWAVWTLIKVGWVGAFS